MVLDVLIKIKTRIYAAPAVKGLITYILVISDERVDTLFWHLHKEGTGNG